MTFKNLRKGQIVNIKQDNYVGVHGAVKTEDRGDFIVSITGAKGGLEYNFISFEGNRWFGAGVKDDYVFPEKNTGHEMKVQVEVIAQNAAEYFLKQVSKIK